MDELSARRERFCVEYIKDYIGTRAAIRAGYSEKGASVEASRLLRNASVLRRVKELERAALQEAGYSPESLRSFIIRQMIAQASVDASDITEVVYMDNEKRTAALVEMAEGNGGQYFLDFGDPVVYIKPTSEFTPEERAAVKGVKQTRTKEGVTIEVQMYDKQAALKALADIAGLTKQPLEGADGGEPVTLNVIFGDRKTEQSEALADGDSHIRTA